MTLMLHRGANEIDYDGLRQLETPPATPSHVPVEHFRVVDLVRSTLGMFGHEVVEEHHGVTSDGMRYFGLLSLKSEWTGYTDTVILRNANDKAFPISVGMGARCFCCDNLSFYAERVVKRRHTANAKLMLPGLVMGMIEPLALEREQQHNTIRRYQLTPLTEPLADHAILSMYRQGIIGVQRIADVEREWREPSFEEFREEKNAWRLFNATTFALTGLVTEKPAATTQLHVLMDEIIEMV